MFARTRFILLLVVASPFLVVIAAFVAVFLAVDACWRWWHGLGPELVHPGPSERNVPRCQQCGYDLRESPERCPECGTLLDPLESTIIKYQIRLRGPTGRGHSGEPRRGGREAPVG